MISRRVLLESGGDAAALADTEQSKAVQWQLLSELAKRLVEITKTSFSRNVNGRDMVQGYIARRC